MQAAILAFVFFATVVAFLGFYSYVNRDRLAAAAAVKRQLGGPTQRRAAVDVSILRDERRSGFQALDQVLERASVTVLLERQIARAGTNWSVGEVVMGALVCSAVLLVVGTQYAGRLAGIAGGLIGLAIPYMILQTMQKNREKKFELQLPDAIDVVVNAMKAGYSFQAAMKFVGDEMQPPVGPEFLRFYDEQRLGMDVRQALLQLQERMGTLDAKMFVTALVIQRETGGNLGEVLSNLATLIRERVALRGQIDTLTAEPKFSARVLSALPVAVFAFMYFTSPAFLEPMFTTSKGQNYLIFSAVAIVVGYKMLMNIADIDI